VADSQRPVRRVGLPRPRGRPPKQLPPIGNRRRDQVALFVVAQRPDAETLKALNGNITDEFRANAGKVGGRFEGNELLLLTTTGAKSGEPRVAPLVVFRIDGKLLIVAGYGGADVNPAWVHNLRANPRAHVEVATGSFDVVARELDPSEREAVIPRINATTPAFAYANYQSKTTRTIPIFELVEDESRLAPPTS
jgi:deazaflavin-dependent oxidoreductase (nitroreductase family)